MSNYLHNKYNHKEVLLLFSGVDNVLKSRDLATLTVNMLKKLEITPQPMFRQRGVPIEPLTLFQKMGVGHLELYILNPDRNSQEYQTLMQSWPDTTSSTPGPQSQTPTVTALASACVLLVWHPACPQEKVVRVLFPGVTPQGKLLEGLEKLRGLAFLHKPTVTTGDLEGLAEDRHAKRTDSQDSGRSVGKESAPRLGKERGSKDEGKEWLVKEKGKVMNGNGLREEGKRDLDKAKLKEKQKAAPFDKNTVKKGGGRDVKKEEQAGKKEENGRNRKEQVKKEILPSKPKNENKTKPKKEAKNDSKTDGKKTSKASGKEVKTDSNLDAKKAHVNTELPKNHAAIPNTGSVSDSKEPEAPDKEEQNQKMETESEENPCGSKMSTPEDMTADFLRLREETETEEAQVASADNGVEKSELGDEESVGGLGKDKDKGALEISGEEARIKGEGSDRNEGGVRAGDKVDVVTGAVAATRVQLETVTKPEKPKVVGFPSPFNKTPKIEQLDLTPTEYTLLDGALRHSPPSRSSPENLARLSPDEETVEPASPDSRPNSAGHTPYCLSPDDVWCNKDTLNGLKSQIGNFEANQPSGSNRQGEGHLSETKSTPESYTTSNPKEKYVLSLGSFKDGVPDPSPSVTTTTTTHSMPAEVSSPQSTEVDESLSMSFEQGPTTVSQKEGEDSIHHSHSNGSHFVESDFRVGMSLPLKKPPRSLGQGSEMGHSRPGPNTLHFELAAHDVDLCLVSPCEFKHFKPPDSSSGASDPSRGAPGPHHHGNNNNNNHRDTSASESNAPLCGEDCPSTTADGALDSDEDESYSESTNSLHDHPKHQSLPPDPPPAPFKDGPPLAPQPDSCMPVPQSDSEAHGKGAKITGLRGKRPPVVS